MTIRRLIALVLALVLCISVVPFQVDAAPIASGTCGKNLTWKIGQNGVMTISGRGEMSDFTSEGAPWYAYKDSFTKLVFTGNVTSVGDYAFERCFGLKSVVFPASIKRIGYLAFDYCMNLNDIYFAGDVPELVQEKSNGTCIFTGKCFSGVVGFGHYPADNDTWSESARRNFCTFGDEIEWFPYSGKLVVPNLSLKNAPATGKIKLSWNKIDGAKRYIIYRSESQWSNFQEIGATKQNYFVDPDTSVDSAYYYRMRAVDASGKLGPISAVILGTGALPRPKVSVKHVALSGKTKLVWSKVADAKNYVVYRATAKNGKYTRLKTTTNTYFIDSTAKVGQKYFYKVVATHENAEQNSAHSVILYGIRDLARPKAAVKQVKQGAKVTWGAVDGAAKYVVYRATSQNGKYVQVKTTTNTYFTDKTVKDGKTYYYKVVAVHKVTAANSAMSPAVKIKIK